MYENLAILALFAFFYSIIVGKVQRSPLSGPLVFMVFGLLAGPVWLDLLDLDSGNGGLRTLADLTLALVLFSDAANVDLRVLKRSLQIPQRMLLIGLPLTILCGFVVGRWIFPELGVFEVAILATMLAATDAALGKAVITNQQVPEKLREGLNIESGLNDGICVPVLFVFIALALEQQTPGGTAELAVRMVLQEIGIGLIVGVGLTAVGWLLLQWSARHGWLTEVWTQIPVVALAFGSFALAQSLDGSGYIAAFTGGLLFGSIAKQHTEQLVEAAEGTGEVFSLLTWVVFGAVIVGPMLAEFTWDIVLYAVLSLTVVRMLPIYLALFGTGERAPAKLFLGWFGPRGLASIVFAVIVIEHDVPNEATLSLTVVCTVFLSVILHGISATPLAAAIGDWHSARFTDEE